MKVDPPLVIFTSYLQELGRRWSTMNPETKEKYVTLAREEKEKFEDAKALYIPSDEFVSELKAAKHAAKQLKDQKKPIRA